MVRPLYIAFLLVALFVSNASLAQKSEAELLREVVKYRSEANNKALAHAYKELSDLYVKANQFSKAISYCEQRVSIYKKANENKLLQQVYSEMGDIYNEMGQYEPSLMSYRKSLKLSDQTGNERLEMSVSQKMAVLLFKVNRNEESIALFEKLITLSRHFNDQNTELSCYHYLIDLNKRLDNMSRVVELYEDFVVLHEKIFKTKIKADSARVAERYEKTKNDIEKARMEVAEAASDLAFDFATSALSLVQVNNDSLKYVQDSLEDVAEHARMEELRVKMKLREKQRNSLIWIAVSAICFLALVFMALEFIMRHRYNTMLKYRNIEIEHRNKIIEKTHHDLQNSIMYASNIQRALLSPIDVLKRNLSESFVFFKPCSVVSGDFYWFGNVVKPQSGRNRFIMAVVDCTGHGVPGAMMSMLGISLLDEIVQKERRYEPCDIVERMHIHIRERLNQEQTGNNDGMDLVICAYDPDVKKLTVAGTASQFVYIVDGKAEKLKLDNFGIGGYIRPDHMPFRQVVLDIKGPTYCYMFSDGYADQFGGLDGKKYYSKNFIRSLTEIHQMPMLEQSRILNARLTAWQGNRYQPTDDVLVIGFKLQ
ncbi:MAG: SpoIIE family protein phosphatase [Salinivirgaceae bacterium]|nr:SpoIIE family protein phosphatase [Salinivirgaceae bacterium]